MRHAYLAYGLLALLSVGASAAQAASAQQTAYYTASHGSTNTYLVDWYPSRGKADVTDVIGTASGSYTDNGVQRLVTLSAPVVKAQGDWANLDSCGNQPRFSTTITRYAFTRVSGTDRSGSTTVTTDSETRLIDGCDAGALVASTHIGDAADAQLHLKMSARPGMADLVSGASVAGLSEAVRADPFGSPGLLPVDVAQLLPTAQLQFARSGSTVGAAVDADQWLMLSLPSSLRGYTRLATDRATGAETWLMADFAAGKPLWVTEVLVTRQLAGGSFGTVSQASRMWESGLFTGSNNPFFIYLYKSGTGERISRDVAAGTETRTPISWAFAGANIVQTRPSGSGQRIRTWVPIGNKGSLRWVMESEVYRPAFGADFTVIEPRVNFYIDGGKSVEPAGASR